jgi:predicted metal-binding protein
MTGTPFPVAATFHVCTGCKASARTGGADGAAVAAAMRDLAAGLADRLRITVATYPCLGGCAGGGRLSVAGPGRWTFVFGGVDPATDTGHLAAFLDAWAGRADGLVPNAERPPPLRRRIMARVPPA